MKKLSSEEIDQKMKAIHPAWQRDGESISREFQFPDFIQAFSFMTTVANHAETLNHHPEWCNIYNEVSIKLTTHDAKGLSELDFNLASKIDQEYEPYQT